MNSILRFLPLLFNLVGQCPGSGIPVFHGEDLAHKDLPYRLSLPPGEHVISWGDGRVENHKGGEATHIYQNPGLVEVTVRNKPTASPVMFDYNRMIQSSKPLVFFENPPDGAVAGPAAHLPAAVALEPGKTVKAIAAVATKTDSFSVEAWLRCEGNAANQVVISSNGNNPGSARIRIHQGELVFEIIGVGGFRAGHVGKLLDGSWHHLGVTYDRVPLFPWNNEVCCLIDGRPAGRGYIPVADAGPVSCLEVAIGGEGFKGAVAGLAIYDDLLFPLAIMDRVKSLQSGHSLPVTVAEGGSNPVSVVVPVILRTVQVAMDPSPQSDNGPALRKAIAAAGPGTRLLLVNASTGKPGGIFPIKSLVKEPHWTSVIIEDRTDFELDGGACTLVFSNEVARYFLVQRCKRVAIRNLSVDLDQEYARVAMYAKIVETNPANGLVRAVVVNGRDGKPVSSFPRRASYWRWRPHDARTFRLAKSGPYFDSGSYAEKPQVDAAAGPGMIRFRLKQAAGDEIWKKLEAYRSAGSFYMINNADFSSNAVSLDKSSHITFENVNYHAVLGMVFLSSHFDHLRVARCTIGLPPGMTAADRPLAAGSDGYHFHLTHGSIVFEDNEISMTDDDPVSLKDSLWTNVKRVDDRRIQLAGGGVKQGHSIELMGPDYKPLGLKAMVTSIDGDVLTLDKSLPAELKPGTVLMNREHHTRDWTLRNNYFHDYYGRVMIYTDHGTVTGNRIHDSYYHLGISDAYFERAGVCANVITHRNLFESVNADTSKWGGDQSVPGFNGITYSANSFLGRGLRLCTADQPMVVRNWFFIEESNGKIPAPVSLSNSPGARIMHNIDANLKSGAFNIHVKESPGMVSERNGNLMKVGSAVEEGGNSHTNTTEKIISR